MANASELERGKFIEHKGELLQVVKREIVIYGTHSHSKLKFTVVPVTGGGEKFLTFGHNDKVDILDVMKKTASIISKTESGIQIMDPVSFETLDASCESHLASQLNEGDEVIFIDYNGSIKIINKKAQN